MMSVGAHALRGTSSRARRACAFTASATATVFVPDCLSTSKRDGLLAVDADARAQLLEAVLDAWRRRAGARAEPSCGGGDDDVADRRRRLELADGAHADLARALVEVAGRDGEVGGLAARSTTCAGSTPSASSRARSRSTWISRAAPPLTSTEATPSTCSSAGLDHVLGELARLPTASPRRAACR